MVKEDDSSETVKEIDSSEVSVSDNFEKSWEKLKPIGILSGRTGKAYG